MNAMEIIKLSREAEKGNMQSYNKLLSYNQKLTSRANQRLRSLEKQTRSGNAYAKAITYTQKEYGSNRFRKPKTISDLKISTFALENFLSQKTSTVRGIKEYEKRIIGGFREKGIYIPDDKKDIFFDFLDSGFFNEFKKYDSERAIEEIADAISNGRTLDDLNEAYQKYQTGQQSLIESWEEWTEI